jgi:hypothetical protein
MPARILLARRALEAALHSATDEGLRDLHEALQTGQFAVFLHGKTRLVRGSWGQTQNRRSSGRSTACPLTALFMNESVRRRGRVKLAKRIAADKMGWAGYKASNFYLAWDQGLIPIIELRNQVEQHLERRLRDSANELSASG